MNRIFGSDIWVGISSSGAIDVDPTMRETSGVYVFAQSLVMRQSTGLGSLIGAPDECVDLRSYLSKGMTTEQLQSLRGVVRNQLLRDQRVSSAIVNGTFDFARSTLTLIEQITSGLGPFTLTLSVSQLTITALLNGQPLGT